jgi:hypothetical protein
MANFAAGFDAMVDDAPPSPPSSAGSVAAPEPPQEVAPPPAMPAMGGLDTPEATQPRPTPAAASGPGSPAPGKAKQKFAPANTDALEGGAVQRLLDTPRTKEAFKRSGIQKVELTVKAFQDFYIAGDMAEKQRLRFNHYETRRQEKLNIVLQERARIIAEQANATGTGDALNFQSLQLMEGLLDTEAKRLEKTLRAQLRYHQAVEKENGLQLDKEKFLKGKLDYRKERQHIARSQFDAKSKQLREIAMAKEKHSQDIQSKLESLGEQEQAKHIAALLDEEVRLKDFAKQREIRSAEKSERWKEKCAMMKLRKEEEDLKKEIKGQAQLEALYEKTDLITERKANAMQSGKIRFEEEALKLVDAKDKIARMERKDLFRRDLIRQHMEQQEERVDTLLKLRDQIVEQRKVRIKQQSVQKGRPQNIRDSMPGPGHYQPLPSCLNEMPVTRISESKSINTTPGSIDMMVKTSKSIPPPGTYHPRLLPNGKHLDFDIVDGCTTKIIGGNKKMFTDDVAKMYKHNPGPGTYTFEPGYELEHSVRMVRDYVDTSDKPPKWCKPVLDTPAPDEYLLDKFMKKKRFKHTSSAPQLGKALSMSIK